MTTSALDPIILAAFGPPPANVDLGETRENRNNGAVIAMLVLATVALVLRFLARIMQRAGLQYDDWTIIVALLFVGGTVALCVAGSANGAGRHIWAVSIGNITLLFKIIYGYTFVYSFACATTKFSILLFYRRIFVTDDLLFRLSLYLGFFLSSTYPIVTAITMANACKPVSFYWNQFSSAEGTCIDVKQFFLAMGIVNMINDVIIVLIPIPQILKLQMSARKKAAISGMMLLGGLVCIASILRIRYLNKFVNAVDVTWAMSPVLILSAIEPSLGIVSACLPHLAPLTRNFRDHLTSKKSSPTGGTPWRSRSRTTTHKKSEELFTYGGSRFSVPGDKNMINLAEADDEIGLTNKVTAGSLLGKAHSTGSGSDLNVDRIMVQSSFVQTSGD